MSIFISGVVFLGILTLLFVFWPVISVYIRPSPPLSDNDLRQATNVALYRDHLAELDASLKLGSITDEEYRALNAELERNLLSDSLSSEKATDSNIAIEKAASEQVLAGRGKATVFFALLALIVLVAAALLYDFLGAHSSWQVKQALDERYALEREYMSADVSQQTLLQTKMVQANQLLSARLVEAVENEPDNLQTLALLGRTAAGMGDYKLAIKQFRALLAQEPDVIDIRAELAQALFLINNNSAVPEVGNLAEDILRVEPENAIALSLLGISAFQAANYAEAITYWEKMIAVEGANTPNAIALQQGIRTAKARMGTTSSASSEVLQDNVVNAQGVQQASSDEPRLSVTVALGEGLAPYLGLPSTSTVFVYARAWQGAKIPLSIARLQLADLPLTVTLTNAMSMAPEMNLGAATQFELVARVSSTGSPIAQTGDWEATLGPIGLDVQQAEPHSLLIDSQRP
ncbi:MAG: cytochrome c-type biogenesis protein CcmH [Candidatus Endobugula sp.]|jgi:cytochrome c-type biogenesis protein CcmH